MMDAATDQPTEYIPNINNREVQVIFHLSSDYKIGQLPISSSLNLFIAIEIELYSTNI